MPAKAAPLKVLAKAPFLAKTAIAQGDLMASMGLYRPLGTRQSDYKALLKRPLEEHAALLRKMSEALYMAAIGNRYDDAWAPWRGLKDHLRERPHIGDMVWLNAVRTGGFNTVGQLIQTDQETFGFRRLYEEDGGPTFMSTRFMLKLLDGSTTTWGNVQPRIIPTIRILEMWKDIARKLDEPPSWT